jgi:D-alanyl-D-alanine carboxypeptidase (penicillin-binding protein 5/6)
MFKPARRLFLAFALTFTTVFAANFAVSGVAAAQPRFVSTEGRYAAIVLDAGTGEVLYERNADAIRYPASISKIMTLYLAFEALSTGRLRPTDIIVVSPHAASMAPSKLGLKPGETITVDDAMRAIAVHSANDMAVALAEKIGGSESRFAALMTLRAQELGMANTHYDNATGLPDPRQTSTARDIATLSRAVMRDYPQYYGFFSIKSFSYHGLVMTNHNGLLGKMPGVDGLKTGFINASGFNLAASAMRDNHRLIAVVLGGNSVAARDAHVEDLLDTGFDVLHRRQLGEKIVFAQNLFEPAPIGPVTRPSAEEGSGDQAGVRIVLTNTEEASLHAAEPAQGAPLETRIPGPADRAGAKIVMAKAEPLPSPANRLRQDRARRSDTGWTIQVGAYKQKAQARGQLSALQRRFSGQLADASGGVESARHGYYRARFQGFSAVEAHAACAKLRDHGETCAVVEP